MAAPPDPRTDLAVRTESLTKRYGRHTAVAGIDLAVPRGSVFGFLGPNGSGKTTTIRVMLGLASATGGRVQVLGEEMPRHLATVLPRVGALVEGPAFYPFLTGAANLGRLDTADRYAPPATRAHRVRAALAQVGLLEAADTKVRAYSLGMKQRLGIANALLRPRELLVLDEPTNGLDPQGTREVRELLRSLAAGGTTVFVSSHLLAEIEQICTHAAVMSAGELVAQGSLDVLRGAGRAHLRVQTPDPGAAADVLAAMGLQPGQADVPGRTAVVVAPMDDGAPAPEDVVTALVRAGVRVRGVTVDQASLEDRFVALTGEGFDVAR
ncbi:ABC transporter ATP-binding protein [Georgenia sp. 10Sc9-8]|uniref:ABC transporter ATP-binding protein n=1 Tax=Georgenia halotolerans TaxID=3028317 RepID=A0ABT5U032_9MICO|nr:ABC transporter ATP-binding protein [Georgenia halotolerans]